MSKDVDIAVVGANLVGDALWIVPLLEHTLGLVLPSTKPEPKRVFISLSARVTLRLEKSLEHGLGGLGPCSVWQADTDPANLVEIFS